MYTFGFEKLEVWQDARNFTKSIYETTNSFPKEESFVLVSQLRRAAISICSNIAEGSSRISKQDQANYYRIAYSSLMECFNQLIIANDLNYLQNDSLLEYRKEVECIANKLNKLRKTILNKSTVQQINNKTK